MYYSEQAIAQLAEGYDGLKKWEDQFIRYLSRDFKNATAKEHARHGFSRRMNMIVQSIEKVFAILPPERTDIPEREEVYDATLYIQSFVINVFGSLENLAWIWVSEKELKKPDGSDLPASWVGLRVGNSYVRNSFSNEFHEYLKTLDPWFDNLVDFRDALVHRIPLYIPPYMIARDQEAAYIELEDHMSAAIKAGKFDEYDALYEKQKALGKFQPEMTHSLFAGTQRIKFHPQLLADFNTVYEVGDKMLTELDA